MRKKQHFRLKFWQRTYLITLALFLVCLFGGIFGVTIVSRNLSFDAQCQEFLSRQHSICTVLAQDIEAVATSRPAAISDLYGYYGEKYKPEGIGLIVWKDDAADGGLLSAYASNLAGELLQAEGQTLKELSPGQRGWQVRRVAGRHIMTATTVFTGDLQGYAVTCSYDVEEFFKAWQHNSRVFFALAVGVSAVFAVGLYFVLRQLYRPLKSLTAAATSLAGGNFAARAEVKRNDEFGDLAKNFNEMAATVEAQLHALAAEAENKQQLVDNLSHEMRTPLTAIGGYAEYIQRANLDEEALQDATETIRFESRRLLNLSEQLVRLSAMAHEKPESEHLDAATLLLHAEKTIRPKAKLAEVGLEIVPPTQQLTLYGNADLLESLLVNLADNAIKATPAGGVLQMELSTTQAGGACFTVKDGGCGMDADTLAHIGQPFYRADKARSRAQGGAGLGVALCKAIATAHDAVLHYESTVGEGTTVTVSFPPCAETFTTPQQP